MKDMSREQWESLPEAADLVKISRKRRNQEYQRYTPVPDSILQSASIEAAGSNNVSNIDSGFQNNVIESMLDKLPGDQSSLNNLTELGQARG
jgi:hypothetical protein